MKNNLDNLDIQILDLLEEDGRASAKSIALKLGITEVTASKRISKIIKGDHCKVVAIADFEKCGFEFLLPMGIRVHGKQLEQVAEKISSLDAVYSVSAVSGIQDLEILCATKTLDETVELLDVTLPAIKGIKSITPAISSKEYKFQTDWAPLGND